MGVFQGEGSHLLAFLLEDKIATRFFRDVNAEVEHDLFSFPFHECLKQVASLRGSNIAREKNGLLVSTEGHSILNQYSQLDQQEAAVFGKWSLKNQGHKEEANRQTCLKKDS